MSKYRNKKITPTPFSKNEPNSPDTIEPFLKPKENDDSSVNQTKTTNNIMEKTDYFINLDDDSLDYKDFYSHQFKNEGNVYFQNIQKMLQKYILEKPENFQKKTSNILGKYNKFQNIIKDYFKNNDCPSICQPDFIIELEENHKDNIRSMIITSDSKKLITGSDDSTIRIWDIESESLICVLYGQEVNSILLATGDSCKLFSANFANDSSILMWDINSHKLLSILEGHTKNIFGLAITLDNKRLISSSLDKTIKIWDITSHHYIKTIEGSFDVMLGIAVTPDKFISAGGDKYITIWDLKTYEILEKIEKNSKIIYFLKTTPDFSKLISIDMDNGDSSEDSDDDEGGKSGKMIIWDLKTMKPLTIINDVYNLDCFFFQKENLFWCLSKANIFLLDMNTYTKLKIFPKPNIKCGALLHSKKMFIAVKKRIEYFDLETFESSNFLKTKIEKKELSNIKNIKFFDNSKKIIFSVNNSIYLWNISEKKQEIVLNSHSEPINSISIDNNNNEIIISGDESQRIIIWNMHTFTKIDPDIIAPEFNYDFTLSLYCPSMSGKKILFGTKEYHICVVELDIRKQRNLLKGHNARINCIEFFNSDKFVSGSDDKSILIWNLSASQMIGKLEGHTENIYKFIILNQQHIFSCSQHEVLKWDLVSNKKINGENISIKEGLFEANINFMIKYDVFLQITDINDKKIIVNLERGIHQNSSKIISLTLSRDSKKIAAEYSDNTICIWEIYKTETFKRETSHYDPIIRLELFENDSKLLSQSHEDIRIWDLKTYKQIEYCEVSVILVRFTNDLNKIIYSDHIIIEIREFCPPTNKVIGVLNGHSNKITCLEITSDSNKIVSGSVDGSIKIWEINSLTLLKDLTDSHSKLPVLSISLSLDMKTLISTGNDKKLKIWSFPSLELQNEIIEQKNINIMLISPSCNKIIIASEDNLIIVWELNKKQQDGLFFKGHSMKITSIIVNENFNQIMSADMDSNLKIWDMKTGDLIWSKKDDLLRIHTLVLSLTNNSNYFFSGDSLGKIYKWDFESRKQISDNIFIAPLDIPMQTMNCFLTSDCKKLITEDPYYYIIWDIYTKEKIIMINKFSRSETTVDFVSKNSSILIMYSNSESSLLKLDINLKKITKYDINCSNRSNLKFISEEHFVQIKQEDMNNMIFVWNINNQEPPKTLSFELVFSIKTTIAVPKSSKILIFFNEVNYMRIWDFSSSITQDINLTDQFSSYEFISFPKKMVIGTMKGFLLFWDLSEKRLNPTPSLTFKCYSQQIIKIIKIENSENIKELKKIAVLSFDMSIKIFDMELQICFSVPSLQFNLNNPFPDYHKELPIKIMNLGNNCFYLTNCLNIFDFENYCIKLRGINLFGSFKNYEICKDNEILYFQEDPITYKYSSHTNVLSMLKFYRSLEKNKNDFEDSFKNNLMIYPFNFNLLHIMAIFDNLKDVDLQFIDWSTFLKIKMPLHPFISLDFQGYTCLDILLEKKNKTAFKNLFISIFNSLENNYDGDVENHFYQKLKFFRYDFNNFKGSFMNFMNQIIDLFGEETEVLNKLLDFSFHTLSSEHYSSGLMFQELEKPIFITTNSLGWLKEKENITKIVIKKIKEIKIFRCLKRKNVIDECQAEINCSMNYIHGISDITKSHIDFWDKILKLSPSNKIFENKNLEILIYYKWETYIRKYYFEDCIMFTIFFLIYIINFIYIFPNRNNDDNNSFRIVSLIFDFADLLFFVKYAHDEIYQIKVNKMYYFMSFWNLIDSFLILGTICTTILDIIYILSSVFELYSLKILVSITLLFFWMRLLSYSKGFQGTGFLIRLLEQVMIDMKYFLIMLFLVMLAFASSGFLLQDNFNNGPFYLFTLIYRLMLGDYGNYDNYVTDDFSYPLWIGMIMFTIFTTIIMLNLLISLIGATFSSVVASEKPMRNIELLGVINEIEKYTILRKNHHIRLRKNGIIGNYLICFHNENHFKEVEKNEQHILKDLHSLNEKIEIKNKSLEANIESLEGKIELNYKSLEGKIQDNHKIHLENENNNKIWKESIEKKFESLDKKIEKNFEEIKLILQNNAINKN